MKKFKHIIFYLGIIALIISCTIFFIELADSNKVSIAERLVQVQIWEKQAAPAVKWSFRQDGTGTLTTNNDTNTYNFLWRIEDDKKLIVETKWLYDLYDEFSIKLNGDNFELFSYRTNEDSVFIPLPIEDIPIENPTIPQEN